MKKLTGYSAVRLALASSALMLLFASCSDGVSDTTAHFAEAEKNITSANNGCVPSCSITVSGDTSRAAPDTAVEVSVTTYVELDLESVERALNFYSLSDNPENKYYYPVHSEPPLTKTLVSVTESDSYESGGTVVIAYSVDTSEVTTNKIAFIADASLLTDKRGNAVLNLDRNDKAGEGSDNFISYLDVDYKAGGQVTETLAAKRFEVFSNCYLHDMLYAELLDDSSGNPTGKIRFTLKNPPFINIEYDSTTGDTTYEYDSTLSSSLSSIYTMQTRAPGSSSWLDVPLSFVWNEAADNASGIDSDTYTAETDSLPYGTQWRLVRTFVTTGPVPDYFERLYGHPAFFFYNGSKELTRIAGFAPCYGEENLYISSSDISGSDVFEVFTSEVYTESPVHIYAYGTGSASSFVPCTCPETQAQTVQRTLLPVDEKSQTSPASWLISTPVKLSGEDDFIVTNEYNKKVECTITRKTGLDDTLYFIEVALKDTVATGTYSLWVGNGLTLASNPKYPSQVHFGVPSDSIRGDISGYVLLYRQTFYPKIPYRTVSYDIRDYVVTDITNDHGVEYRYYLDAGEYSLVHANGTVHTDVFTDAGYQEETLCESARVIVQDSNGTQIASIGSDQLSLDICISSSGVYTLQVVPEEEGDKGYAAFFLYR